MTRVDPPHDDGGEPGATASAPPSMLGVVARALARLWVISLLLFAAAFGGIAVNLVLQDQARLALLRRAPGPDAYAVVAYRRELERQVRALSRDWRADAVPSPPSRPRLMEEIDLARPPERERVRAATELAPISAPQ